MERLNSQRLLRSRYMRANEKDGLVVAAHQLHPEPLFFERTTWLAIEQACNDGNWNDVPKNILQELSERGLVVADDATDQAELDKARLLAKQRLQRPTILYLMMAQGCNWTCHGCPIPGLANRYGHRLLDPDDAKAGLDLWQQHIGAQPEDDEPYFIIFYGGEPLLNRPTLEKLLPHIQRERELGKLPRDLELMLCTNGQLMDTSLAQLLALHSVTVAVGLDGIGSTNDVTRITRDGSATFEMTERAIRTLVKHGTSVVVSTTITPANVGKLPQLAHHLQTMGVTGFGFNLLKGASLKGLTPEEVETYARMAARMVLSGMSSHASGSFYEYQLQKKLLALQSGSPYAVDCTCYGNQIVIQADGQVGNCPFERHDLGHVRDLPTGFQLAHTATVQAWQNRLSIFGRAIETESSQAWLDGGGCAWSSKALTGHEASPDTCNATFVQEVQHELIWTLLPIDRAVALRRGEMSHWGYRRLRPLHNPTA